jgi:hypothetical protein
MRGVGRSFVRGSAASALPAKGRPRPRAVTADCYCCCCCCYNEGQWNDSARAAEWWFVVAGLKDPPLPAGAADRGDDDGDDEDTIKYVKPKCAICSHLYKPSFRGLLFFFPGPKRPGPCLAT